MRTFNHVGIPTTEQKAGENYAEGMKLHLTDHSKSPNAIEWLRFDKDSWMHPLIQTKTHIAYTVDNLETEMKNKKVLLEPTDIGGGMWISFIEEEGIAIELMYQKQ